MSIRSALMIIVVVAVAGAVLLGRMRHASSRRARHRESSLLHRIDRTVHEFDSLVERELGRRSS